MENGCKTFSKKKNISRYFVVLLAIVILVSCDLGFENKNDVAGTPTEKLMKWMPPEGDYHNGYLVAVLDDLHFKVPKEYVGQHDESGFVDIVLYWPDFKTKYQIEPNNIAYLNKLMIISLHYKMGLNDINEQIFHQIKLDESIKSKIKENEHIGLSKYYIQGGRWVFLPSNFDINKSYERSVPLFICSKQPLDNPNRCLLHTSYSHGIEMRIAFSESILSDWEKIHPKIVNFIRNFEIKE